MKYKFFAALSIILTVMIGSPYSAEERAILDGTGLRNLTIIDHDCDHCSHLRSECLQARENSKGASGKWLDTITPKRGWTCTGAEDLEDRELLCQMCERETVRYVHHMIHGTLNLDVGCVCSGYMEGFFDDQISMTQARERAQQRVRDLTNRKTRRDNFPDLKGWKQSTNKPNNTWIKKDNHVFTVIKGYGNMFAANVDGNNIGGFTYNSKKLAQLAAFDHVWPPVTR